MHERWMSLLAEYGLKPELRKSENTITVSGVGNGTNSTDVVATYPGAVQDSQGVIRKITFDAPVIPNNDVPAFWGNASLNRNRAVIDTVNRELVLCGMGKVIVSATTDSWRFPMTLSPSGHWIVPVTCLRGF